MHNAATTKTFTIPAKFLCPITQTIMREPVTASDGHVYEKEAIENWMALKQENPVSPITCELLDTKFPLKIANYVKSDISEFIQKKKAYLKEDDIYLPGLWKINLANAIHNKDEAQFNAWLQKDSRLKHALLKNNKSALALVFEQGNLNMVKKIIALLGEEEVKKSIFTKIDTLNPFYLAWRFNDWDCLSHLIEVFALTPDNFLPFKFNKEVHKPPYLNNNFLNACRGKKRGQIDLFLSLGADINAVNKEGQSGLHCAGEAESWDVFLYLIRLGIKSNLKDSQGATALELAFLKACSRYDLKRIDLLLNLGTDINTCTPDGRTALHLAAADEWKEGCVYFIKKGINVNCKDKDGKTAFLLLFDNYSSLLMKEVKNCIKLYNNNKDKEQQQALLDLSNLQQTTPEVLSVFLQAIEDSNPTLKAYAISALSKWMQLGKVDSATIQVLLNSLEDEDHRVRRNAVSALREWVKLGKAGTVIIQALLNKLADKEDSVRGNAGWALGEWVKLGKADEVIIQTLLKKLEDESVRDGAVFALGEWVKLGKANGMIIQALLKVLKNKNEHSISKTYVISSLGAWVMKLDKADEAIIQVLLDKLGDIGCHSHRVETLLREWIKLGKADGWVIQVLLDKLGDKSYGVIDSAASLLREWIKLGKVDDTVIQALLNRLTDEDSSVRDKTASILCEGAKLGKVRRMINQTLLRGLEDKDSDIRRDAVFMLSEWVKSGEADDRVIQPLLNALEDKTLEIRVNAAWALVEWMKLGKADKAIIRALFKRLGDEDSRMRNNVVSALREWVKLGKADEAIIQVLLKMLGDEDGRVRNSAMLALGEWVKLGNADGAIIQAPLKMLGDENWLVRSSALGALREWIRLGKADEAIIQVLLKMLGDEDGRVKNSAMLALGEWVKLGKADGAIIQTLLKMLGDEDWTVRANAVLALREWVKLGNADGVIMQALLNKRLKDEHHYVRERAVLGVGECVKLGIAADGMIIQVLLSSLGDWPVSEEAESLLVEWVKASKGDVETVQMLLNRLEDENENYDVRNKAVFILQEWVKGGRVDDTVIQMLLQALKKDGYKYKYLFFNLAEHLKKYLKTGHQPLLNKDILELLLEQNKSMLEEKDQHGNTVLMSAVYNQHVGMVNWLLVKGASLHVKDLQGNTPLLCAVFVEHPAIVTVLIEKMTLREIEEKNDQGNTALLVAAQLGNKEILEILLEANANHDAINNDKLSINDILKQYGHEHLIDFVANKVQAVRQNFIEENKRLHQKINALEAKLKERDDEIQQTMQTVAFLLNHFNLTLPKILKPKENISLSLPSANYNPSLFGGSANQLAAKAEEKEEKSNEEVKEPADKEAKSLQFMPK